MFYTVHHVDLPLLSKQRQSSGAMSDDDVPVPERYLFSSSRILKRPEILKIYATSIRRFCRSNSEDDIRDVTAVLRAIFDIFRTRVSNYWNRNEMPRGERRYSKLIDYCRTHLFGLTCPPPASNLP